MTIDETKLILHKITNNYPNAFANKTKEEKYQILNDWYKALESYDYQTILNRLVKHICNSKYTPTIADLKNKVTGFNNFVENPVTKFDEIANIKRYMTKYEKYMNMNEEELKAL